MSGSEIMPVLFVGHGSPMNAIEDNRWSRGFRELGQLVPRPRAILSVSAHWFLDGTFVTRQDRPPTIHDFGGFPQELYGVEYPAPGSPDLAARVLALLGDERAALDGHWGLDHGTWSVLVHMFPEADVPVIQLSLDRRLGPRQHLELARPLRELRAEGVLILGSGNVTHNLAHALRQRAGGDDRTPEWASWFDAEVARAFIEHDDEALADRLPPSEPGQLSHPSLDHYLPLLYVAGAAAPGDQVRFPVEGFDWGSLSMRSVLLG